MEDAQSASLGTAPSSFRAAPAQFPPLLKVKILNISQVMVEAPRLTSFLPSPCPGARNSDTEQPPWAGNSSPGAALLLSAVGNLLFLPGSALPTAPRAFSCLFRGIQPSQLHLQLLTHLPPPSKFSFHPTVPKSFFPLFLPQFPYLLYQHPLQASTDLSAVVTCPNKAFFIHFSFWRA